MKTLKKLRDWFTDARRQAVHAALATVATLAVTTGAMSDAQAAAALAAAGSGLILVQGLLGLSLLAPSDAARWLGTTGRASVYGLATTIGGVGLVYGIVTPEGLTQALAIASAVIGVASSFLSVVNVQTTDSAQPRRDITDYQDHIGP